MNNQFFAFWLFLALVVIGCTPKKKVPLPLHTNENITVVDTTTYGICAEGTAMHTIEMVTDEGDTVTYSLNSGDVAADVQGGLLVGDRLAIVAERGDDGYMIAQKVINITSLLGKWNSLDKTFELRNGGVVVSGVKEPKPYTEWKILNGKLILSADTFDITFLGKDSLYLKKDDGLYRYRRLSTEQIR